MLPADQCMLVLEVSLHAASAHGALPLLMHVSSVHAICAMCKKTKLEQMGFSAEFGHPCRISLASLRRSCAAWGLAMFPRPLQAPYRP